MGYGYKTWSQDLAPGGVAQAQGPDPQAVPPLTWSGLEVLRPVEGEVG